ncbi:MAG: DUF4453 domain-containing protein [Rubellimicrobium sp.]|nr:DUF4453 domain-containing protein [Rubellimicrobium sp.]
MVVRTACAVCFLALLPGWAQAAGCEEYWYLRNLIAHRAGFCFSSPLGQAVFDNSSCTTTEPHLSASDQARMEAIRQLEAFEGCAVDTSRSQLDHPLSFDWSVIATIPIPTGFESGCVDYRYAPFPLRTSPDPHATIVGEVRRGDSIGFNYEFEDGWMFVVTDAPTGYMGWAPVDAMPLDDQAACRFWAG